MIGEEQMEFPAKIYVDERIGSNGFHALDYRNTDDDIEYIKLNDFDAGKTAKAIRTKATENIKKVYERWKSKHIHNGNRFEFMSDMYKAIEVDLKIV